MEDVVALRRRLVRERGDEVRALHRLAPVYNLKLAALIALWAVGLAVCLAGGWWAGWVLTTSGLLGLAILMHDGAHHLLARGSAWNRWLAFVCGAPALISATAYRYNHTTHHAVTGTDDDPGDLTRGARKLGLSIRAFTALVLVLGTPLFLPSIAIGGWRKADARGRRQIAVEYALIGAAASVAVATLPFEVLLHGWLVPFVLGGFANNLRSLAEHSFTERSDPLRNARTVRGSWFTDFVHSNVNHHWEHHLFPGVPWYRLPALRRLLERERLAIGPPEAAGYLAWFRVEVWPVLTGSAR